MKHLISLLFILVAIVTPSAAQVYYVAPNGAAILSTDINNPGSLVYAVQNATAGDTVWVKAGNYGDINLIFNNSGNPFNPIVFIGYKNVINDIDSTDVPVNIWDYLTGNYGGSNPDFPTIDGVDRATAGLAMQLYNVSHITIKNFHILNYNHGISTWAGQYLHFENIICAYLGDPNAYYNGTAIGLISTSYSSVRNAFVYNAAAEGIKVMASSAGPARFNLLYRCHVYCDDTSAPQPYPTGPGTDYYFALGSSGVHNTEYNQIIDCYAERVGNVVHHGHGFAVLNWGNGGKTRYNTFRNCTTRAIRGLFVLRGQDTKYNHFEACSSYAGEGAPGSIGITCARYNTFDKIKTHIYADDVWWYYYNYSVKFYKDTVYSPGNDLTAIGNIFTNCLFQSPGGIGFGYYMSGTGNYPADSNSFTNCTFVNPDTFATNNSFILSQRLNTNTSFVNCIISGYANYMDSQSTHASPITYENCCFHNNGFNENNMPDATILASIWQDPEFEDFSNLDFRLQATSPCIDTGKEVSLTDDFDGNPRPCNDIYDIGAFEFQDNCNTTGTVSSSIKNHNVNIYPNPAQNEFHVQSDEIILNIRLIDISGKIMKETPVNDFLEVIYTSGLKSGVYILQIQTVNRLISKRIIVMKD